MRYNENDCSLSMEAEPLTLAPAHDYVLTLSDFIAASIELSGSISTQMLNQAYSIIVQKRAWDQTANQHKPLRAAPGSGQAFDLSNSIEEDVIMS